MHDVEVTTPAAARLFNGLRLAMEVRADGRGRPRMAIVRRKCDLAELARVPALAGALVQPAVTRLPPGIADEAAQLLETALDESPRQTAGRWHATARARRGSQMFASAGDPRATVYRRHVATLLRELRVAPGLLENYRLPMCVEPAVVEQAGFDAYARPLWLERRTRAAWHRLRAAAATDGVSVQAVSGFRSAAYQARLVARKLASGQPMARILAVSALPGYSEHHLGTVLDLHDGVGPPLEESFADTEAFAWLQAHAGRFGFALSYPRENPYGIAYEPWHWRYHGVGLPPAPR